MQRKRWGAGLVCLMALAAGCVGPVKQRVVTVAEPERSVLIASRNSEFKNALVAALMAELAEEPWRIKVTDITDLVVESPDNYDAILVIDRVWGGEISTLGADFIRGVSEKGKLILVATTHNPDWRAREAGVDAITAPSPASSPQGSAKAIASRIRAHVEGAGAL